MGSTGMRWDSHVGLEVPAPLGRSFGPKAGFLFVGRMTGASLASHASHLSLLQRNARSEITSLHVRPCGLREGATSHPYHSVPLPPKSLERARMRERLTGE